MAVALSFTSCESEGIDPEVENEYLTESIENGTETTRDLILEEKGVHISFNLVLDHNGGNISYKT